MEILRGKPTTVSFIVPPDLTSATYDVYRNGEKVGHTASATVGSGMAHVTPSWGAVAQEGQIQINLRFIYDGVVFNDSRFVNVISTYLDIAKVKEMLSISSDEEAMKAERAARFIINSHCGQNFNKEVNTYNVTGSDTPSLTLPNRLLELKSVNGQTDTSYFDVRGDGFFLYYQPLGVPPVKADYFGLHQHVGGVIHNPNGVSQGKFKSGKYYQIKGLWGYHEVPEEVKEAAEILIGVYADPDSEYRDRYLTSMTAADWRIQFNAGAFIDTGHVRADQLLAPYVLRRGWAVL